MVTNSYIEQIATPTGYSFFDLNFAFSSVLSWTGRTLKIKARELIKQAKRQQCVNRRSLAPSVVCHSTEVEPWIMVKSCPNEIRSITQVRLVNDGKPHDVFDRVRTAYDQFKKPVISVLGLSLNADIADLHESPELDIFKLLAEQGIVRFLPFETDIHELAETPLSSGLELASLRQPTVVVVVDNIQFITCKKSLFLSEVMIGTRGNSEGLVF